MLAHKPDFVSGQMLTGPSLQTHLRPIGYPHGTVKLSEKDTRTLV